MCIYCCIDLSPNRFGVSADTILGEIFEQNSKRGKCANKGKMCGKLKGKNDSNREQNIDKWGKVSTSRRSGVGYGFHIRTLTFVLVFVNSPARYWWPSPGSTP